MHAIFRPPTPRLASFVQILDDTRFRQHQGFDLGELSLSQEPTFRVPKNETISALKSRVSKRFGCAESQFHLWVLAIRQNKTVRPDARIPEDDPTLSKLIKSRILPTYNRTLFGADVEAVRNIMAARANDLRLYLDVFPEAGKVYM
jgi:ubiquitin carboxyl-terminal hydrolase 7